MQTNSLSANIDPEDIQNAPLGSTVYEKLKSAILSRQILPGTPLQESELGTLFQVSRTPVREALHELLREELVRRHGRFYQVSEMSTHEIGHLYELREALERMAVQLCIERGDDEAIGRLAHILTQQMRALEDKDNNRLIRLDSQFHLQIAKLTGNQFLYQQLVYVHDKVILIRGQVPSTTPTWSDRVIIEHERILSALTRRDTAVADAEMRYHLNSVVRLHRGLTQKPLGSTF